MTEAVEQRDVCRRILIRGVGPSRHPATLTADHGELGNLFVDFLSCGMI
jgi:hypothetical protein